MWEALFNKIVEECNMPEKDKAVLFDTLSQGCSKDMLYELMAIYFAQE